MLKYKMPASVAREFVQLAIPEQALFIREKEFEYISVKSTKMGMVTFLCTGGLQPHSGSVRSTTIS